MAYARSFLLLFALSATATGCIVEDHSGYYNPPVYQSSSLPTCPTVSDPARGVTIDTDVGPKLVPGTGESVSVEYSSGGLWHLQSTCDTPSTGYSCAFEVTAEVFDGSVSNITGETLEPGDMVGSSCPDTAYMMVTTDGDTDGMIFTTMPGTKVRITATLDNILIANLFYWTQDGKLHNDANANPLDMTPVSP